MAGHIGIARSIHGDVPGRGLRNAAAAGLSAEESRVDERGARGVEPGDEGMRDIGSGRLAPDAGAPPHTPYQTQTAAVTTVSRMEPSGKTEALVRLFS